MTWPPGEAYRLKRTRDCPSVVPFFIHRNSQIRFDLAAKETLMRSRLVSLVRRRSLGWTGNVTAGSWDVGA